MSEEPTFYSCFFNV